MASSSANSDTISKIIQEKERIRKDRTTCLESQSRDFSSILALLKDIHVCFKKQSTSKVLDLKSFKMRENQAKSVHHTGTGVQSNTSVLAISQPQAKVGQRAPLPGGYSRYDQEIFQKETVADFEIETEFSFHGLPLTSSTIES
jgi:hypothetical protein